MGEQCGDTRSGAPAGTDLPRAAEQRDRNDHQRGLEVDVPWRASGETARRRDGTDTSALAPQELQVAALVARGMSNRDAAAQLIASPPHH
jgi:DNA-binding NarL/FixJ family response regulator